MTAKTLIRFLLLAMALSLVACGGGGGGGGALGAPTLLGVTPDRGSVQGGSTLILQGANFTSGAVVMIGARAATDVTALSGDVCRCTTPSGTLGETVDVSVQTAAGTARQVAAFTYRPHFAVEQVTPDTGFAPGGMPLTVTGVGFAGAGAGAHAVEIGGAGAADTARTGDTALTCTLPATTPGPHDVTVRNDNGVDTLSGGFTSFTYPPRFLASDVRLDTGTGPDVGVRGYDACREGANLYVVWTDTRNGEADVFFRRSTDHGVSWDVSERRLDTDAAGAAQSDYPNICADGDRVYVVWEDNRGTATDVYFNRSLDGGLTWLASDVRLDSWTARPADSTRVHICCSGANVVVAWNDERGPGSYERDIYANRSADAGTTWLPQDVRLDTDTAGSAGSWLHALNCDGNDVFALWMDVRDRPPPTSGGYEFYDAYFSRSTDGGATWLAKDVRLGTQATGSPVYYKFLQLCRDGPRLYAVWNARGVAEAEGVRFNRSLDGGATWLATDVAIGDAEAALLLVPRVCCRGERVYVAWEDFRDLQGGQPRRLYFNRSLDAGDAWLPADVLVSTEAETQNGFWHRIEVGDVGLRLTWDDRRQDPALLAYMNTSIDDGLTWLPADVLVGAPPAGSHSGKGASFPDGARLHVIRTVRHDGSYHLYFTTTRP